MRRAAFHAGSGDATLRIMGPASLLALIIPLIYLFLLVLIVWQVLSALNRITKGVEAIAETLRRIESKGPPAS